MSCTAGREANESRHFKHTEKKHDVATFYLQLLFVKGLEQVQGNDFIEALL